MPALARAKENSTGTLTLKERIRRRAFELYVQRGGKSGYMKYRTVPVFPQVGDKVNRAIEAIATKQSDAPAALERAQAQAVEDIKKSGVKIDL